MKSQEDYLDGTTLSTVLCVIVTEINLVQKLFDYTKHGQFYEHQKTRKNVSLCEINLHKQATIIKDCYIDFHMHNKCKNPFPTYSLPSNYSNQQMDIK